ncbi:hypothetical protein DTPHA_100908 [Enterococcus faecium]|nr:hypothetical protein DTPHA_200955 [Enterococcus faecium]SAY97985.1 hypothetical protein DTPHA_100908 [Enterococcus faecium]SAZ06744.1 hypothetical protein DTPHA_901022 [Enterococcus faecium]
MATFGKFDTTIVPSEIGEKFKINTHVMFTIHGKSQTGTISKQLKNSAVVEIDETAENANLMTQSKGVVIVNYKELKKDLNLTISAFLGWFFYMQTKAVKKLFCIKR